MFNQVKDHLRGLDWSRITQLFITGGILLNLIPPITLARVDDWSLSLRDVIATCAAAVLYVSNAPKKGS